MANCKSSAYGTAHHAQALLHGHLICSVYARHPTVMCHLPACAQDTEAEVQRAKKESEGRLAALRKELLAAEDAERAELEKEYK